MCYAQSNRQCDYEDWEGNDFSRAAKRQKEFGLQPLRFARVGRTALPVTFDQSLSLLLTCGNFRRPARQSLFVLIL